MKKIILAALLAVCLVFSACGSGGETLPKEDKENELTNNEETSVSEASISELPISETNISEEENTEVSESKYSFDMVEEISELAASLKTRGDSNPIMTQAFGADPYALVYGDTIYIYMTADSFEYDTEGNVKENSYSKIKSIHVVSTKDMKNFTDCGEIPVAGTDGIAKWAHNSWAPAAAYKNIDGKDKFFLYFADNGGGIGVLSADSPTGPFEDPLGHGLITRDTPNCGNVLWLFDPAVLVDDDGTGYIYFGGGVPEGKISAPGTGRCARLGDDMISLATEPVAIDVPYLFEDSGIHKYNNKYYYSYCTNWNVDAEGTKTYGFNSGEIAYLVSDSPLGPFTYAGKFLENPGKLCGLYGNNHHAVFSFKDEWYVVYHSRLLEKNMGIDKGYRATFINKIKYTEDGKISIVTQSTEGPAQLCYVNPYETNSAVCVSKMAGTNAIAESDELSYKDMVLGEIETGDFIEVTGVDFGDTGAKTISITVKVPEDTVGAVELRIDFANSASVGKVLITPSGDGYATYTAELDKEITGVHYLYFVFAGSGYTVKEWKFN